MCGLFGVVAPVDGLLRAEDVVTFTGMGRIAQRRGSDASGVVRVDDDGRTIVVKSDLPFRDLVRSPEVAAATAPDALARAEALFGHSRLETHGFSASQENNQPVVVGPWTVLHNGIVTNHRAVRAAHAGVDASHTESDTAAIGVVLTTWVDEGRSRPLEEVFAQLEGELSIIAVSTDGEIVTHTNVGNMYRVESGDGTVLLSSEPRQFPKHLQSRAEQVVAGTTLRLREPRGSAGRIEVVEAAASSRRGFQGAMGLHLEADDVDPRFRQRLAAVAEQAHAGAADVRRCSVCVLPETFPGIEFDSAGRCSVCASFVRPKYAGIEALERDLRAASPDGTRVLVCLSGGRDSCYVLHLVAELGFVPVTYTYDWGMVTTAARENMAKMCGLLGAEHILVSPNIRRNRLRIRRALRAWLDHPRLGTLPILMAGDKPYFRYAAIVADERGGLPAVMADHPMETTGFKSMLAGARPAPGDHGGVSYRLTKSSLARMALSYAGHAVRSPALFPSLAMEGAVGFVDYYMRKHTFVRPFSYIEWDEAELESTLRERYGWSGGEDRASTSWRMGDGTAPFYNLMYLLALGMTEHDALRSNQIRFGLIDRDDALRRLQRDNAVNDLGVASYFATIGIDPNWAMDRIEAFAAGRASATRPAPGRRGSRQ